MDRQTIFAIILITIVILLLPSYYNWVGYKSSRQPETIQVTSDTAVVKKDVIEKKIAVKEIIAQEIKLKKADSINQTAKEFFIEIETPLINTKISNKGGGDFIYWYLKRYYTYHKKYVSIIDDTMQNGFKASYLAMSGEKIWFSDFYFSPEIEDNRYIRLKTDEKFKAIYTLEINGSTIIKEVTFYADKYHIDIEISITNVDELILTNEYQVGWINGLPANEMNIAEDYSYSEAYAKMGGEIENYVIDSEDKINESSLNGKAEWSAIRTKYFISALIPQNPENILSITFNGRGSKAKGVLQRYYNTFLNISTLQNNTIKNGYKLYLGPLDHTILSDYQVGIEDLIMSRGWYERLFRPFSLIILKLFKLFQSFIPNYGIVIIIFSILVKIVVYPLTKKSYKSMREMGKVQPLMTELREKYKSDPQRLNREMMKLYKEHNINPLGGCIPMLLQMPLLVALFIVFRSTIQLRGASFIPGWINDLSAPDTLAHLPFSLPLYGNQFNLLPILMALTMIFQSKMTMKDPKQKAMVYLMPIFMLLIFNQFPSGLNLYYTLFNLWSIIQQKYMERGTAHEKKVETIPKGEKGKNRQ
jgi:YidC/Oxa1 family membrane protein insertase